MAKRFSKLKYPAWFQLGAQRGNVIGLVMREVVVLVIVGAAIGLPCAFALGRIIKAQLFGVEPTDVISMGLATALLLGVALAAAYVPARRAAKYDPVRVLRSY